MTLDMESVTTSSRAPIQVTPQSSCTNTVCPLGDPEQAATPEEDCDSENEASASSAKKSYAQVVLNGVCKATTPTEDSQSKQCTVPKTPSQGKRAVRQPITTSTLPAPSTPIQKAAACPSKPSQEGTMKPISCKSEPKTSSQSRKSAPNEPEEPAPHPDCPSDRSIFVCRLPLGITEAKVAEAFAGYGTLLSGEEGVRVRTGTSACYAFLTYSKPEGAVAALDGTTEIDGETIVCEVWNPRRKSDRRPARGTGYNRGKSGRYSARKQAPQSNPTAPQTPKQHT